MRRTIAVTFALGALALAGAADTSAQQARAGERGVRRGPAVEGIMSMRERLELTEDQIADLDAIRSEIVQRRSAEAAELAELRSRLAAGQIHRSELMAYREDRREANAGVADETRARIDAVLTETQRSTLEELRTQRAFVRGRMSARRGGRGFQRGPRPGAGFRDGVRPQRDRPMRGDRLPRRQPRLMRQGIVRG